MNYTLNIHGQLVDLSQPLVMGILNVTPDSFYAESRQQTEQQVADRARQIVNEGALIIDIGACSTRPGSTPVSEAEEMSRLRMALSAILNEQTGVTLSVDTFRPDVARMAVEEYGVGIVNDVSGGSQAMYRMTSRLGVPYILTAQEPDLRSTLLFFADRVQQMRDFGQKDIVLDPGFGFGKTREQNICLLGELDKFSVMELPLLVGVSRKRMIYETLHCTPDEAMNGTTVFNTVALMKGASILRVHDVHQAVECCRLLRPMQTYSIN